MRHAAGNVQRTTNDMQHATCSIAACNRQREIKKRPLSTGNKATRQQGNMRHAADTAQKTAKPCNACNRQRATHSTAFSKHTRNRHHAAGIETYDETIGIRTLGAAGLFCGRALESPRKKDSEPPSAQSVLSTSEGRALHVLFKSFPGRDSRSLEVRERPASFRLIPCIALPAAWCRFRVCLLHAAAPVVCCILCVASVPCCALVVEYNASRMLVVRCPLLAAHEMRRCRAFSVAPRMCSRPLACRLPSVARYRLHALPGLAVFRAVSVALLPCCLVALVPWCLLSIVFSQFHVARCMLHVALHVVVVRCMLLEVWRMLPVARCRSFAVRCILPAAWRMLSGCCVVHAACRQVHFPPCLLHVVCCMHGCMLHIFQCCLARCLLRFPRHGIPLSRVCVPVLCCRLHVPCCFLPLCRRLSHLTVLSAACRLLPDAEWHSAISHAAHRGGARN
jgi:hypothetical protein